MEMSIKELKLIKTWFNAVAFVSFDDKELIHKIVTKLKEPEECKRETECEVFVIDVCSEAYRISGDCPCE